jgi:hypothetical protein
MSSTDNSDTTTSRARTNAFEDEARSVPAVRVPDCHRGGWLVRKRDRYTLPAPCGRLDCQDCKHYRAALFALRLAVAGVRWQPAVIELRLFASSDSTDLRAHHRRLEVFLRWLSRKRAGEYAWCREAGKRLITAYLLLEHRPIAGWRDAARRNGFRATMHFIRRPLLLMLPAFAERVLSSEARNAIPTRIAFAFAREYLTRCDQALPFHARRFATSVPRLERASEWHYTGAFPTDAPNTGDYADYPFPPDGATP